jgi:hypothetical protein
MKRKKPVGRRAKALTKTRLEPQQLSLFDAAEPVLRAPSSSNTPKRRVRGKAEKPPAPATPPILSPREAAAYLGVSKSTLKAWRGKKVGPPWRRRGARLVFYRLADLDHFLEDGAATR